jgi:hypothetical protein
MPEGSFVRSRLSLRGSNTALKNKYLRDSDPFFLAEFTKSVRMSLGLCFCSYSPAIHRSVSGNVYRTKKFIHIGVVKCINLTFISVFVTLLSKVFRQLAVVSKVEQGNSFL